MREEIETAMRAGGVPLFGVVPIDKLRLLQCAAQKRLPVPARSVIVALFPYYSGKYGGGNISKYAMPRDYHSIVTDMLEKAADALRKTFPDHQHAVFCDNSPVPEVEAARLAGLGSVGDNGLLINSRYGSYVFIGEIVTTMEIETSNEPGGGCLHCGACAAACPARQGAKSLELLEKKSECLSAVTQKKGTLTPAQRDLIRAGGSVWGCDICQDCCPMNRKAEPTPVKAFQENLKSRIEKRQPDDPDFEKENSDRAFLWRGAKVIKRNICIIEGCEEDTITADD